MKSSLLILLSSLIVTFSFLESHENNEIVNKPVRIKKSNETDYQKGVIVLTMEDFELYLKGELEL